jgi:hypothetical protein
MLTRRALLTGGVLAGTVSGVGAGPADPAEAEQGSSSGRSTDERTVKVLEEIRDEMRMDAGGQAGSLEIIRSLQRDFLKGRGKFPDFIEIGIDVWDSVINWHIRTRQVPQVQRTAEGRYAVPVFQTNLVLRHDVSNSYIGQPYDAK